MKRSRWIVALGLVMVVAGPAPGLADVGFAEATLPPNARGTLSLRVGVERPADPGSADRHNVRVVARVPAEFVPGWCASPAGWSCSLTHTPRSLPYYAWDRQSGPFNEEDVFQFAVRTPEQEGEYPFPVEQRYSDGTTVRWFGPAGSPRPAPAVTVTASR